MREIYEAQIAARKATLAEKLKTLLPTGNVYKTLEIGCGHGHFLVHHAQTYAERFCLGIDLISQRLAAAERKAQRAALTNCYFLKARAEELSGCLPMGFLWNEILIFYPDPWPKVRRSGRASAFRNRRRGLFRSRLRLCCATSELGTNRRTSLYGRHAFCRAHGAKWKTRGVCVREKRRASGGQYNGTDFRLKRYCSIPASNRNRVSCRSEVLSKTFNKIT